MSIKKILDEVSTESSTNKKIAILESHKENELLKKVMYLANSGRIKFHMKQIPVYATNGKNMPLEWALEHISDIYNREVTGDAAKSHLKYILETLTSDDAYVIERIIDKDCKIGVATKTINKIWEDLIEKVGYMGCKPYSKDLLNNILKKGKAFSQKKMDGQFVNIIVRDSDVSLDSRQGEPTTLENPKFLEELKQLKDCVLNAELTMDGIERYKSNGMITSLISIAGKKRDGKEVKKEIAKFESLNMDYRAALNLIRVTAWDILTIDEYYNRSSKVPYHKRLDDVTETLKGYELLSVVETRIVTNRDEAMAHFEEILANGEEGTVVKSMDGEWVDSKPVYQCKIKREVLLDLKIVGFSYGDKGTKNEKLISSLEVESEDGLLKTTAGGINEELMEDITNNQEKYLFTIAEIKCNGVSITSKGYSLMSPRFKKSRIGDKNIANTLAECIEIHNASSL